MRAAALPQPLTWTNGSGVLRGCVSRLRDPVGAKCRLLAVLFFVVCSLILWVSEPADPCRGNQLPEHCAVPIGWEKVKTLDAEPCLGSRKRPENVATVSNPQLLLSDYFVALAQEMEEMNEPLLLTRGTGLGVYRDCSLYIDGDHDIDVAMFPSAHSRLNLDRVQARAMWIALSRGGWWQAFQFFVARRSAEDQTIEVRGAVLPYKTYHDVGIGPPFDGGVTMDMWVFHANQTHWLSFYPPGTQVLTSGRTYIYKKRPLQGLRVETPSGPTVTVYVPAPAGQYMADMFGDSWETPVKYNAFYGLQANLRTSNNPNLVKRMYGLDTVFTDCAYSCQHAADPMYFILKVGFVVVGSMFGCVVVYSGCLHYLARRRKLATQPKRIL